MQFSFLAQIQFSLNMAIINLHIFLRNNILTKLLNGKMCLLSFCPIESG